MASLPENAVIAVDDLRFGWSRASAPCLDVPRFHVGAGERVFLYGPSGSGKSTLLGLLGGVLLPQQGSIRVLDQTFGAMPSSRRDRFRVDHIGFIFQQFNLIPYLSVLENILLPCRFSARRQANAVAGELTLNQEARRLLAHLDLDPALDSKPVTALSVGQQQRVAAARALIGKPEIVIADEPTSSLDARRQQGFLDLLLQECEASAAALLFVSHDRRLAGSFHRDVALEDINRAAAMDDEA